VWLAWSVKESVYKFLKRHQLELVFSPTKIVLQNIIPPGENKPWYIGTVIFNDEVFHYQSQVTDEYVNTVINNNDSFEDVKGGMGKINPINNEERSAMASSFLQDALRSLLGDDIRVEKSEFGYPVILRDGVVLNIAVSLAHDGGFAGYSVKLT
jgi:hypothetical protein